MRNINLTQNWRTPDSARGQRLWTPGHYVAPLDMPEKIADAAIRAGAAVEIKPAIAAPAKTEEASAEGAPTFSSEEQSTGRTRRQRSLHNAPENK